MMNENYKPLKVPGKKPEVKGEKQAYEVSGLTIYVPYEYSEKLKDFAYWEGDNQKDVALQALIEFLDKREIKPRPEKVKNRMKPGRKLNVNA